MKKEYQNAEIEIIVFSACDIVTASGPDSSDTDYDGVEHW